MTKESKNEEVEGGPGKKTLRVNALESLAPSRAQVDVEPIAKLEPLRSRTPLLWRLLVAVLALIAIGLYLL